MCDTQLSVPTPYGCERRHRKPTRSLHPRERLKPVWKLPKLKQKWNVESWIQWNCHRRFAIKPSDSLVSPFKDKCQASQQLKSWFNVHGIRMKHPCHHLQISHLSLYQISTNSTILHPTSTNYSYSETMDKSIPIAWWFLDGQPSQLGPRYGSRFHRGYVYPRSSAV